MKAIYLFTLFLLAQTAIQAQEKYLITGSYTEKSPSEGIYVYRFNTTDGSFKEVSHVKTPNPSFLVVSPDQRFVYAIHELGRGNNGGEVASFSFDKKTGVLTPLNKQLTVGDHPCYVEIDKTGKWIFAGNYSSGSLSVLPIRADGSLDSASTHIQHTGSGPNKDRQAGPHVHCTYISPDNRFLYVPDLGLDKVMIYSFDAKTGKLQTAAQPFAAVAPGGGPRHIDFSPNKRFAYLIEEMGGRVNAYRYNNGALKLVQTVSSLAKGESGFAGSADIHVSPDGKFLYATNRGDYNNIAIYKINATDGKLTNTGFISSGGKTPRNFSIDPSGNFLLCANQETNNIVIFKRDKTTGQLTPTGKEISTGKPVCLKWMDVQ